MILNYKKGVDNHYPIKVKEEDKVFFAELRIEVLEALIKKSRFARLNIWNILLTPILSVFWLVPGVVYLGYMLFSKAHLEVVVQKNVTIDFFNARIDIIQIFTTGQGILIAKNFGSVDNEGGSGDRISSKINAYEKGANALVGIVTGYDNDESFSGDMVIMEQRD